MSQSRRTRRMEFMGQESIVFGIEGKDDEVGIRRGADFAVRA